ncbi:hypothetical protein B296_00037202, partial [Ensete ventricosum]
LHLTSSFSSCPSASQPSPSPPICPRLCAGPVGGCGRSAIPYHQHQLAACGRRSVGYPLFVLEVSTLVRTRREAMAFQGTTTKCTACAKTVYLVDKLTADNRVYHRACFRCHHCKGTLKVRPYPPPPPQMYLVFLRLVFVFSVDCVFCVLMCSNADIELKYSLQNANKVSSAFAGTREKCVGCKKTVYPIERVISLI